VVVVEALLINKVDKMVGLEVQEAVSVMLTYIMAGVLEEKAFIQDLLI
jgi:hypothetical protein